MTGQVGPAVARQRLRVRLRAIREERGLAADTVAREMYWSLSKLNRIETGAVTISPVEVRALLEHYGIRDKKEVTALMSLAATSRSRQWWSSHKLTREYQQFVAYEAEASRISMYHATLIPGLLQTEDYAKNSTAKVIHRSPDDADVLARIEIRMERQRNMQQRMQSPDAPEVIAALDEAVLRRPVGGPTVMRHQLDHLLEMGRMSAITLIVVPLSLAGHPGLGGTFELLEFAGSGDPDVLFVESAASDWLVQTPEVTAHYRETMKILEMDSLTGDAAVRAVHEIRDSLGT
ncbi:helix-turn-helix domain-containing protein [Krasilnikovia sp. MM14-A1259]|uniref:helix-turn-helix domain-containing protein n=1 Tax=Krasilnikovia sp. MM14-A1259 TaxID=3373539 RepID=UPI00381EC3AB